MDIMLNFRVPPKIKEQLEKLAEATGRSKTYLAVEALQSYLDEQAWQIADIRQGIKEADALDFATPKEVAALKKNSAMFEVRWTRQALRNLESITAHIARDNPEAAKKFSDAVFDRVEHLAQFLRQGALGEFFARASSLCMRITSSRIAGKAIA